MVVIAVVNITALVVANFQAYRNRTVRTEFNESSYIAMANVSFLQAICICVPIIFLTRESPQAYFIVLSVVLFILSGAILGFIFVPKCVALRERLKNGGVQQGSSVRISGINSSLISGTSSLRADSARSGLSTADPVTAVVQQFQALSWENKMAVKQKLSLTEGASSSSRSLVHFESGSGEIAEQAKNDASTQVEPIAEAQDSTADAPVVQTSGQDKVGGSEEGMNAAKVTDSTIEVPKAQEGTASESDSTEKDIPVATVDETIP